MIYVRISCLEVSNVPAVPVGELSAMSIPRGHGRGSFITRGKDEEDVVASIM